jgi:predicted RNA-binding protein YlqC (UPF0109 family)
MNDPRSPTVAVLIHELAQLYVGNPSAIRVEFQDSADGRSCYFVLKGDKRDDSRLIGRDGCHVHALNSLVEQVGRAQGRTFTFRLLTDRGRHEPYEKGESALTYDPRPARDLLCRWLAALGVAGFSVEATPGPGARRSLSFVFEIKIGNMAKAASLTISEEGFPSIVGSLGTLYRAIAQQQGVRFQLNLADRVKVA